MRYKIHLPDKLWIDTKEDVLGGGIKSGTSFVKINSMGGRTYYINTNKIIDIEVIYD